MRIFFPTGEMPFAGHPTIGSAVLLAELRELDEVRFELKAGLTPVKIARAWGMTSGTLTAPVVPFKIDVALPSVEEAAAALGLTPQDIGFDGHGMAVNEGGPRFFIVPVSSREALAKSRVSEPAWSNMLSRISASASGKVVLKAAYVYARGDEASQTSYRARMYAPGEGIIEDPATGSATVLLAAQLLKAEALKDGTHIWHLEQGFEMGRPSHLRLEADVAKGALLAVRVAGGAVRVTEGEIEL